VTEAIKAGGYLMTPSWLAELQECVRIHTRRIAVERV